MYGEYGAENVVCEVWGNNEGGGVCVCVCIY